MPVDRAFWSNLRFTKGNVPAFHCPTCHQGMLLLVKESLYTQANLKTLRGQNLDYWEPEFWEGRFSCMFECQSAQCGDCVSAIGDSATVQNIDYSTEPDFTPVVFNPPLHIFSMPKNCPENIQKEIIFSFGLFRLDTSSSLNHLRKAVELIMSLLGIRKHDVKKDAKGKNYRKPRNLHKRIEEYAKKKPESISRLEMAARLEAIKWWGNDGSHASEPSQDELFNAFDVMEHLLQEHFEKRTKTIDNLVKNIIKKKRRQ